MNTTKTIDDFDDSEINDYTEIQRVNSPKMANLTELLTSTGYAKEPDVGGVRIQ